jgi:hypothetical protein
MDPCSLTSQCSSVSSSYPLQKEDVCFKSSLDSLGLTHIITRSPTPSGSEKIAFASVVEDAWAQMRITPQMTLEELISEPVSPRITLSLLKPLEITAIANSPQLRFDINYTRKLRYKKVEAFEDDEEDAAHHQIYRQALKLEIQTYSMLHIISPPKRRHQVELIIGRRLRKLLTTIKSILKTLVPKKSPFGIERIWDVDLILQEIASGHRTFASHAKSLSNFLLRYSSPSREQRLEQLPEYFESSNLEDIISGLFEILDVLELLKLDSANYLLRHYSPHLINATTSFGLKHFGNKILDQKLDPIEPRQWFLRQLNDLSSDSLRSLKRVCKDSNLTGFINGVIKSIVFRLELPTTFDYDKRRTTSYSKEFNTILELRICYLVFIKKLQHQLKRTNVKIPRRAEVMESLLLIVLEKGSVVSALSNIAVYFANTLSGNLGRLNQSLDSRLADEFTISLTENLNCDELRRRGEVAIYSSLFLKVSRFCNKLHNAPLWEVYNQLFDQKSSSHLSTSAFHPLPLVEEEIELDSLAKRIAQLSLINWRIFAPLIYLNDDFEVPDMTCMPKIGIVSVGLQTDQTPNSQDEGSLITGTSTTGANLDQDGSKNHATTDHAATEILPKVCFTDTSLTNGRPRGATTGSSAGNGYQETS